ncbi:hypothetical protein AVEN_59335-1 [Araneus ventricosus]|uniref:Uncharacterized protein n=1 Tax=Araneus ventricosus TaxID=182803 RepID=A0A4Y2HPE0_ARAVE|nr:hypothetical protein AVEN_59335-1 [Araneus ventricosus]
MVDASDFPIEHLQQFLSFASSIGPVIVIQEVENITQHARMIASDGFTHREEVPEGLTPVDANDNSFRQHATCGRRRELTELRHHDVVVT